MQGLKHRGCGHGPPGIASRKGGAGSGQGGPAPPRLGREAFVERSGVAGEVGAISARCGGGSGTAWMGHASGFTMDEGTVPRGDHFKRSLDDGLILPARQNRIILSRCARVASHAHSNSRFAPHRRRRRALSIRYGDSAESIVVATTRAETCSGRHSAVAVTGTTSATRTSRKDGRVR